MTEHLIEHIDALIANVQSNKVFQFVLTLRQFLLKKYLFAILSTLFVHLLVAQSKYETNIRKADTVSIKGGKTTINKADKVIIENYNTTKPAILLTGITEQRDSLGIYFTQYIFKPSDGSSSFQYDIKIQLDAPFLEPLLGSRGLTTGIGTGTSMENVEFRTDLGWAHVSGTTNSSAVIFQFRTLKPVKAQIIGALDGRKR